MMTIVELLGYFVIFLVLMELNEYISYHRERKEDDKKDDK